MSVKECKYSGKTDARLGEALVYMPDGSVVPVREVYAGVVADRDVPKTVKVRNRKD